MTARSHFEIARDAAKALHEEDPKVATYRKDLVLNSGMIARVLDLEKKPEEARKAYEEATRLAEEILKVDERNGSREVDLLLLQPHVGRTEQAIETAYQISAGLKVAPEIANFLSQVYALAARRLPPDKAERASVLLAKAVESVRKAIRTGFRDRAALDHDHDFDPIRGCDDFQALLRKVPPPG